MPPVELAVSAMDNEGNVTKSIKSHSNSRKDAFVIPTSLELSDSESEGEVNRDQEPQPTASAKPSVEIISRQQAQQRPQNSREPLSTLNVDVGTTRSTSRPVRA